MWRAIAFAFALAMGIPSGAAAEVDAAPPQLSCLTRSLRIMAAEMSGLRLQFAISGATSADQQFAITLEQTDDQVSELGAPALGPRTICTGTLTDGAGDCLGIIRNGASSAFGYAHVTATLLPRGTQLELPRATEPAAPPIAPPRLDPLPEESDVF